MGKSSRDKGSRGEREAVKYLSQVWPEARRGLQPQGGEVAPDVEGTPLWVEVKTRRTVSPAAALQQAERDTDGRTPIAWLREDHRKPQVAIRLAALMRIADPQCDTRYPDPERTMVTLDAMDFLVLAQHLR